MMLQYVVTVWDRTDHIFLHKTYLPTLGQATDRMRALSFGERFGTDLANGDVSIQLTARRFDKEESCVEII